MSEWRRRVLVVDDDAIVRSLVSATLQAAGFEVAACADIEAARSQVLAFDPDLVVLEANMTGGPAGVQFGSMLAALHPEIALLYLTRYPTALYADPVIADHVRRHSVLVKDDISHAEVLIRGVEEALLGHASVVEPQSVDAAVRRLNSTQLDILGLVAQGLTNAAIAEQRGTRERTVERQLKAAYDSLGIVTSREQNARVVAAMKVAQSLGWVQLATSGARVESGLWSARRAEPHADRIAAAIHEWQTACGPAVRGELVALIDALGDGRIAAGELDARFSRFARPDQEVSRGVELLVISAYVPPLQREVEVTLRPLLDSWFPPGRERTTRTLAAVRAFAVGMALGYVTESWRDQGPPIDLSHEAAMFARAFAQPSSPQRLPAIRAGHLERAMEALPGENEWDLVFQATLDCVGELGLEASTIDVVAAASGIEANDIEARYATMRELFLQASDRMLASAIERNQRYQQEMEALHSKAIADACMIRENMRPERRRIRTITLEQLRLSARDPLMQQAFRAALRSAKADYAATAPASMPPAMLHASVVSEIAMTTGLGIVAQLRPETWRLPLDAVLVAWRRSQQEFAAGSATA